MYIIVKQNGKKHLFAAVPLITKMIAINRWGIPHYLESDTLLLLQHAIYQYFIAGTSPYRNTIDWVKSKFQGWIQTNIQRNNKFSFHYNRPNVSIPILKNKEATQLFHSTVWVKGKFKETWHKLRYQFYQMLFLDFLLSVGACVTFSFFFFLNFLSFLFLKIFLF